MRAAWRWRSLLVLCAALLALACWWLARLDHGTVKAALDARSTDGDVESYDAAFHARIQFRLKILAFVALAVAIGLVLVRRAIDRSIHRGAAALRSWWKDVNGSTRALWASIGRWEAVMLVLLLAIAAVLRGARLALPVTYDEAFTCTYYAVRPLPVIISDYSYPNNHVLHTLLVKACLGLFGWGEVQARLPAFAAAMLALVLCWIWTRSAFGRAVAMLSLGLCAVAPPLVEYGALARGYSLTWACMLASLLVVRQFARTGNAVAAVVLAAINALGLWAVPVMVYATAAIHVLAVISPRTNAAAHGRSRAIGVLVSGVLCAAFTLLLYAPALVTYGAGHMVYHDTMGSRTWASFGERASDLLHGAPDDPMAIVVMIAMFVAAFAQAPYRRLVLSFAVAIVPLVLVQRMIGPARIWLFLLFIVLPAVPLAIVMVMDVIRRVVVMPVAVRTIAPAAIAIVLMASTWATPRPSGIGRYPGAGEAAAWFTTHLGAGDRVLVNFPCEAPLEFHFRKHGIGIDPLYRIPAPGASLWFVVGKDQDHTFDALAAQAGLPPGSWSVPRPVVEVDRMAIFAASFAGAR